MPAQVCSCSFGRYLQRNHCSTLCTELILFLRSFEPPAPAGEGFGGGPAADLNSNRFIGITLTSSPACRYRRRPPAASAVEGRTTRLPAEASRGEARKAAGDTGASLAELLYLRTPHHVCLLTASAQQHPFSFLLVERAPRSSSPSPAPALSQDAPPLSLAFPHGSLSPALPARPLPRRGASSAMRAWPSSTHRTWHTRTNTPLGRGRPCPPAGGGRGRGRGVTQRRLTSHPYHCNVLDKYSITFWPRRTYAPLACISLFFARPFILITYAFFVSNTPPLIRASLLAASWNAFLRSYQLRHCRGNQNNFRK